MLDDDFVGGQARGRLGAELALERAATWDLDDERRLRGDELTLSASDPEQGARRRRGRVGSAVA